MRGEFAAGLKYVRDCMPPPMHGAASVDWRYVSASTLGGGVLRKAEFPAQSCHIPAEARLIIFSDGVFEVFRDKRQMWNLADCIAYLAVLGRAGGNLMDELLNHVHQLRGSPHLNDDFSIIEAKFH